MEIEHFIVARDSSIDESKKTLSVFDFLEDLTLNLRLPAGKSLAFPVQIIAVVKRTSEIGQIRAEVQLGIQGPGGKIDAEPKVFPISLEEDKRRCRLRIGTHFNISEVGEYTFRFELRGSQNLFRTISINITEA